MRMNESLNCAEINPFFVRFAAIQQGMYAFKKCARK